MKLDTGGLESTVPPFASSSGLLDGFSAAPWFEVPTSIDVSCNVFGILWNFLFKWEKFEVLLAVDIILTFFFFGVLYFDGFQKDAIQMVKPAKGTTTLAFIFKEGVMVAADSRASMGGYICMSFRFFLFLTCK